MPTGPPAARPRRTPCPVRRAVLFTMSDTSGSICPAFGSGRSNGLFWNPMIDLAQIMQGGERRQPRPIVYCEFRSSEQPSRAMIGRSSRACRTAATSALCPINDSDAATGRAHAEASPRPSRHARRSFAQGLATSGFRLIDSLADGLRAAVFPPLRPVLSTSPRSTSWHPYRNDPPLPGWS
jgi:hypothetical protein